MTGGEFGLCVSSVICASASQLFIKSASIRVGVSATILLLGVGAILQLGALLLGIMVLRSLELSQIVPFAAGAYILVPIGSHIAFDEQLLRGFWFGALLIIAGIVWMNI